MSEAVITALITGGLALIGVWLTNRKSTADLFAKLDKQSELSDAKLDKEIAVVKTEIENLSNEVRKHNAFAERIPALEEKAKAADRRLTDLEHR
ncbi:MAG: hypothetical protein J6W84_01760 [Bacteroidales bacterium]|nr:hypothetical protein [Bacteroidales bacterium]